MKCAARSARYERRSTPSDGPFVEKRADPVDIRGRLWTTRRSGAAGSQGNPPSKSPVAPIMNKSRLITHAGRALFRGAATHGQARVSTPSTPLLETATEQVFFRSYSVVTQVATRIQARAE